MTTTPPSAEPRKHAYHCGCTATGNSDLPRYCPVHGTPPDSAEGPTPEVAALMGSFELGYKYPSREEIVKAVNNLERSRDAERTRADRRPG